MIFGFYEPENERKVQLDLFIDRNDFSNPITYRKVDDIRSLHILDLGVSGNKEQHVEYHDLSGNEHDVCLSVTNDGQTITVKLSMTYEQD